MKRVKTAQRLRKKGKATRSAVAAPEPPPGSSSASPAPRPADRIRAHQQLLSEDAELPETYGETKIILVPVHPFLVHIYWDLSPGHLRDVLSRLRRTRGMKGPQPILRFYDTGGPGDEEGRDSSGFDVDVQLEAMNWYVHVWKPARSYVVELGLKTAQGRFIPIARSNGARLAPALPSENREVRYLLVRGDYEQVEPVSQSLPELPERAVGESATSAVVSTDFSEPQGWFLGSEPRPIPDRTTWSDEEALAGPVQSISSPHHRQPEG